MDGDEGRAVFSNNSVEEPLVMMVEVGLMADVTLQEDDADDNDDSDEDADDDAEYGWGTTGNMSGECADDEDGPSIGGVADE